MRNKFKRKKVNELFTCLHFSFFSWESKVKSLCLSMPLAHSASCRSPTSRKYTILNSDLWMCVLCAAHGWRCELCRESIKSHSWESHLTFVMCEFISFFVITWIHNSIPFGVRRSRSSFVREVCRASACVCVCWLPASTLRTKNDFIWE